MNPAQNSCRVGAFTLVEMLCVIGIIAVLFALLMPAVTRAKARAKKIQCIGGLGEIGRAFHLFANDHGGKFTTQVPTNQGGALEFVLRGYQMHERYYFSYQLVRPLAGEIVTPKLFACPADMERWPATNFSDFNNHNFSYDIGLQADPSLPGAILAVDRNSPACCKPYYAEIKHVPEPLDRRYSWPNSVHQNKGNILFADTHVEESTDGTFKAQKLVPEDLMYPDVEGSAFSGYPGLGGSAPPYGVAASPGSPRNFRTNASAENTHQTNTSVTGSSITNSSGISRDQNCASTGPKTLAKVRSGGDAAATGNLRTTNVPPVAAALSVPPPIAIPAETHEPTFVSQIAPAMMESFESTRWLLWLLLLLLLLILLARWLDGKLRRRRRARA